MIRENVFVAVSMNSRANDVINTQQARQYVLLAREITSTSSRTATTLMCVAKINFKLICRCKGGKK